MIESEMTNAVRGQSWSNHLLPWSDAHGLWIVKCNHGPSHASSTIDCTHHHTSRALSEARGTV